MLILLFLACLFATCVSKSSEPISHRAARLLQPGIIDIYTQFPLQHDNYSSNAIPISKTLHSPVGSFKAYRPDVFHMLRRHAGVSEVAFIKAIDPANLVCIGSDSKSGSAFWKTADNNYVLKTIKHYECKNLMAILDSFAHHMTSETSCISAILGVYRVKMKNGGKKYFMIAKNVYSSHSSLQSQNCRKYDLKGSTIGRRAKPTSDVMKDLDLLESRLLFKLGHARDFLLKALARDANFLMKHGFMDYSLLVSIEGKSSFGYRRFFNRVLEPVSTALSDKGKVVCLGEDHMIYHFGIIDFLQRYIYS
jgi:phosphatidylinositol-4-phosphate 5-kinase-like protein 1